MLLKRLDWMCTYLILMAALVVSVQAGAAPTLIPGSGFSGPTPQPGAVGSGVGLDARAIARWDVVPNQMFDGTFNVGVVAFHMRGINRVEFSVEGGPWASVSQKTLNPRTGVVEYWATLDASLFSTDRLVEVRAIAYPNAGVPRVLGVSPGNNSGLDGEEDSLFMAANPNGSYGPHVAYIAPWGSNSTGNGTQFNPYRTAAHAISQLDGGGPADGIVVYLHAGNYQGGDVSIGDAFTAETWVTVAGAPTLSRSQVNVQYPGYPQETLHQRVANMTFHIPSGATAGLLHGSSPSSGNAWLDNIAIIGESRTTNVKIGGPYATDILLENNVDGIGAWITRNATVRHIGGDCFTRARLLINGLVEDMDRDLSGVPSAHPDVWQIENNSINRIVYGLTAINDIGAQGVFSGFRPTDVAIVNAMVINVDRNGHDWPHSHSINHPDHMVIKNSVFKHRATRWDFDARNVLVDNSIFGYDGGEHPNKRMHLVDEPETFIVTSGSTGGVPLISLLGQSPARVFLGETFTDPGAVAFDSEDGDLTDEIQVASNVNTSVTGVYSVTYTVTDTAGNSASPKVRFVSVFPADSLPAANPIAILSTVAAIVMLIGLVSYRGFTSECRTPRRQS